ncbi:MAG: cytidylate kinase family protein [Clostridiales bacterium]|nr:cytidylate kinase family protein [Clostridiales bacterium]
MHITLTGNLGGGKSTICNILKEQYGYEIYSTGTVLREIANERGVSVLDMNKLMCEDHKYDHLIDDTTARISRENPDRNIVFDSRLAWNFVEKSFRVFLSVDINEAARRVFGDSSRGEVETYKSVEDCREKLIERAATENVRYEEIYGIHYFDFGNYNLVIDSSYTSPQVLAQMIVNMANAEDADTRHDILMSPRRFGKEYMARIINLDIPDEVITIKESPEGFEIVDGEEVADKAAHDGCVFVRCRL